MINWQLVYDFVRRWILTAVLLIGIGHPAVPQKLSFGVKVGAPLTASQTAGPIADGGESVDEPRVTAGPTVELHLPLHLSFEVDALWRRNSYRAVSGITGLNFAATVTDWQFPFLVKYSFTDAYVHPFIDGGVVYRRVSNSLKFDAPHNPGSSGVAVGGGVTLKTGPARFSPEIRYTRWPTPPFAAGYNFVLSTSNQVDLLIGLTF